tara:strand:- start:1193 stop:2113 length:921 start_codon:yes stop_codon:yes gene_type:complete
MKKQYSVTVIGLGNIGFLYDIKKNKKNLIKTHSKAINKHPNFKLLCGIDINKNRANKFQQKYNVPVFSNFSESIINCFPDIVVVAVPTNLHKLTVIEIIKYHKPKYILIEKPMGGTLKEATYINKICKNNNVGLVVNYPRVCDKDFMNIKKFIKKTNKSIVGNAFYTKGLIHNGSHFVNLLENYFGKVKKIKVIEKLKKIEKIEKQLKVKFDFQNASILFTPLSSVNRMANILELFIDDKKINFSNDGNIVVNYLRFKNKISKIKTEQYKYQYLVYNELLKKIKNKKSLICDGNKALETFKNFKGI